MSDVPIDYLSDVHIDAVGIDTYLGETEGGTVVVDVVGRFDRRPLVMRVNNCVVYDSEEDKT